MERILEEEYRMLSRLACDKIRGYIADNRLKAGDRLPTERALAEQLEVSRPVIREALGTLEALGLIVKRQGKGIFLKDPNFSVLFHEMMGVWQQDEDSADQVLQFRVLLEQAAVAPIIEQADDADYERLSALIAESEKEGVSHSDFIRLDYLFHSELLGLTRNALFIQLTDVVNKYFHWVEASSRSNRMLDGIQRTIRQHREIVRALQAKDREGASRLLKMHLTGEG
ncbi:FadR/GntR family transcriptional regulator [Cohnella phaseoli]|uniref:GntR family transcriptional repressor for pyruvate dehydrogenase complex n=1 Tax=Cohnella phaseoli TaxID=456490 RepID=A0A3D9HTP6_9BACL|nr:FadR/GntR family transcriptional regulator [Cohnella phaseoli]RED52790.1 GntR family transcriptional repressor for pyruvate dehydrogenase complex [Cohnella phaseoli]